MRIIIDLLAAVRKADATQSHPVALREASLEYITVFHCARGGTRNGRQLGSVDLVVGVAYSSRMTIGGSSGFDFLLGSWEVHNRKIFDNADPACAEWIEFEAHSEVVPILLGGGNLERMIVSDPPDGEAFEGVSVRIFEPETDTWGIWWSSTRSPGKLDIPVRGQFEGENGVFECGDIVGGLDVLIRFEWFVSVTPRWQQSFSYDRGATWATNWVMDFTRT